MIPEVHILMGSKSDLPHVNKIISALTNFDLSYKAYIASAHKSVDHLLELIREIERTSSAKVYITVAGRSNALSGMVDANVVAPVIACPPYSDSFNGVDIFSSIRMPSGVAPTLVLEPINAALLAAKIMGKYEKVKNFQNLQTQKIMKDHNELS